MRVRFDQYVCDSEARQLLRRGRRIELPAKAFDLLALLIERRPTVVSRAELHDRLWPGAFVGHTSLARLVAQVRGALGDRRDVARFVRTIHGHGYSFCGEAAGVPASKRDTSAESLGSLLWGTREIGLGEGDNFIGRAPGCTVRIDSPRVSRRHACIRISHGESLLEDLGSKNGTFLKGRRVAAATRLADGDEIVIGPAVLFFCSSSASDSTQTTQP
jgi:DNA-binding winged helix-turn-helix (wHTH) protein